MTNGDDAKIQDWCAVWDELHRVKARYHAAREIANGPLITRFGDEVEALIRRYQIASDALRPQP